MKIILFDTETGGISCDCCDILQLSYQIIDYASQSTLKEVNLYFSWPDDKSRVKKSAIDINGLTEEFLSQKTLSDRHEAIRDFSRDLSDCDYAVAHNASFDIDFINATAEREGLPVLEWPTIIDTMTTTINLCCLPDRKSNHYKRPKLSELAECLYVDTSDISLHDSSSDVELLKRCFITLLEKKFYKIGPWQN